MQKEYDVVILGGGLAGLTLSLQLKIERPETNILVIERRADSAPTATHKVGESTVELGTFYLREVLGLADYLDKYQLPKYGLRYFFSPEHNDDISRRFEFGPRGKLPVPSHQIDRGIFENDLVKIVREKGVDCELGSSVKTADISSEGHVVKYTNAQKEEVVVNAKWVADATGRASLLKRKFGFQKEVEHKINAAWFRLPAEIDLDDWSENKEWSEYLEPGFRRLATNHLMGTGYWLWLIPLVSGNTSIGIVADPSIHPFEDINKFDKAMDWIKKHEPQCYEKIEPLAKDVLDFRVIRHFSHNSGKVFSKDRWGVTGESGPFLDPFYSPGTDFISINNTFLSDLILRELEGEDIDLRTAVYEQTHLSLFENWLPIYQDKYKLMGNTQIMIAKIIWDWAIYWSVPALLFTNKGYTDLGVLRALFAKTDSIGRKFGELNAQMQKVFVDWLPHQTEKFSDNYIDIFDLDFMIDLHKGIDVMHDSKGLPKQVKINMDKLEHIAAQIFRLVSNKVNNTPMDIKIDPYSMELGNPKDVVDGVGIDTAIAKDIDILWLNKKESGA